MDSIMSSKISPNRRRSISVLSQGSSGRAAQQHRRRAYSIAPGEKLSPAAKARRIMKPRKSILKASMHADDSNGTQAMDLTEIASAARSRRVSFASHAHVRVFRHDKKPVDDGASPGPSSERPTARFAVDEDEESEHTSRSRRRSSRRRSSTAFSQMGEQSMELDDDDDLGQDPSEFQDDELYFGDDVLEGKGNEGEDEDEGEGGDIDDDMDMTEAVDRKLFRKRSLSLGGGQGSLTQRRRSSLGLVATSSSQHSENQLHRGESGHDVLVDHELPEDNEDATASSGPDSSFISEGSSGDHTTPMEFTVPMGQSLHPAKADPVWNQLRAMTHAGETDTPSDGEAADDMDHTSDMEVTVAVTRLMEARRSLGLPPSRDPFENTENEEDIGLDDQDLGLDETFTDDGSFADNDGDRTINLTQTIHRSSIGSQAMDETDILSPAEPGQREQVPIFAPPSIAAENLAQPPPSGTSDPPRVFSAPPRSVPVPPAQTSAFPADRPFTFTLPPKAIPSVAQPPRSPSKLPVFRGTAAFAPPIARKSPKKRPAPEDSPSGHDSEQPSPAKKQAVTRLAPAKPSPAKPPALSSGVISAQANKRTGAVRRPSGYFAQRKSLGAGLLAPLTATASSQQKATGGRASLGSVPVQDGLYPDLASLQKELPSLNTRLPDSAGRKGTVSRSEASTVGSTSPMTAIKSPKEPTPMQQEQDVRDGASTAPLYPILERSVSPIDRRGSIAEAVRMTPDFNSPPRGGTMELDNQSKAARPQSPDNADDLAPSEEPQDQEQEDFDEDEVDEEGPPISIHEFLDMAGIHFVEEITAPRRSTILPSQLKVRSRRRSSNTSQHDDSDPTSQIFEEIPLADFTASLAVDIPQLELYSTIANEMTAWIDDSRKICREADEEVLKLQPSVFREFANAQQEDRELYQREFALIKAHNRERAKAQWYDWRKDWVEQLRGTAQGAFADLESDAKLLRSINSQAQTMLPTLEAEYEKVMEELQREEADIAELENDDEEFLAELKATIQEQDAELEAYLADVSEAKAKLARLEEKQAEFEAQKQENSQAILHAEHVIHIQKESTSAEVLKLKDELEALENLHSWRCVRLTPDAVELVYASRYHVTVPCARFKPIPPRVTVRKVKDFLSKDRDAFPQLAQLMLDGVPYVLKRCNTETTLPELVQTMGDFWCSCVQFRTQLTFLNIKYPVSLEVIPAPDGPPLLVTRATVLFPTVRSKARISFILDAPTYTTWPMSIGSLRTEAAVAYGKADPEVIVNAVEGRLAQASPSDNHGCLLDACIEAAMQYQ